MKELGDLGLSRGAEAEVSGEWRRRVVVIQGAEVNCLKNVDAVRDDTGGRVQAERAGIDGWSQNEIRAREGDGLRSDRETCRHERVGLRRRCPREACA